MIAIYLRIHFNYFSSNLVFYNSYIIYAHLNHLKKCEIIVLILETITIYNSSGKTYILTILMKISKLEGIMSI